MVKDNQNRKFSLFNLKSPWDHNTQNVWIASTISLSRNLSKFTFPNKLDMSRREQVITLINDGLKKSKELKGLALLKSQDIGPLEKEFLYEHYLTAAPFHQAHGGEGFIVDESSEFLATINVKNHLELQCVDYQQELEKTWNRLVKIETQLGNTLDFAYNSRYGFLTADPLQCGTACSIALYLHIPAIIHTGELAEITEKESDEEISITGLQGSPSEMIGDLIVVRNTCTIGLTEEYIIASLRMWATKAVVAEISIRSRLKKNNDPAMKNKIARALGLLKHAYQLDTIEALNALSLVKLGVDLKWIEVQGELNLNEIFFNSRRAHLTNLIDKKIEVPEIPLKRAEYLHQIAEKLKILF